MNTKPTRVLHCLARMERGGIQTWLTRVLRNINRERYQFDFLVQTNEKCSYDDEVTSLGSRIIPCLFPGQPWVYAQNFRHLVNIHGPYDVIHSHNYLFAGFELFLAQQMGIPMRIAHIYPTEDWRARTHFGWTRALYRSMMIRSICRRARYVLFDSRQAKEAFVGMARKESPSFKVLYCGTEISAFQESVPVGKLRAELDIAPEAKVVITVARYVPHKNHRHLLEIAKGVTSQRDDVMFLLVGDGPLYPEIRDAVSRAGLESRFRFVRSRPEIVSLYKSCDLMLFPSLMEGFGLVVVEAAAAGLPVVASRIPGIVDAAQACPDPTLVEPDDTWGFVHAVLNCLDYPKARYLPRWDLLEPFDILTSVKKFTTLYASS